MTDSNTPTFKKRRQGQRMSTKERKVTQDAFLAAFEETANILTAAEQVRIDRSTVYAWLEHDELFGLAYHLAEKAVDLKIEDEIHRRGVRGWKEPVYYQGERCGEIMRYSDTLLIFLAKKRMPEYREKGPTIAMVLPKEYVAFDPNQDGVERE